MFSAAKPVTKAISDLVAAAISVRCSCTIFFGSTSTYVCLKSLNIVKPQYRSCMWQQLTYLKTLDLWRPITGTDTLIVGSPSRWCRQRTTVSGDHSSLCLGSYFNSYNGMAYLGSTFIGDNHKYNKTNMKNHGIIRRIN